MTAQTTLTPPKRPTAGQLAKVRVELVDRYRYDWQEWRGILLRCQQCGLEWESMLQPGGRMARGYWKCPNGCNARREG
jgi:hypothetical protein